MTTRRVLPNGVRLISKRVPSGLVAINVAFDIDAVAERGRWGIRNFVERVMLAEEKDLKQRIDGMEIEAQVRRDAATIAGLSLKRHSHEMTEILKEIIDKPVFPKELVDREKELIQGEIRKGENSWNGPYKYFKTLVYKGHPYSNEPIGTDETICALTRDDLAQFHSDHFRNNMVISFVGDAEDIVWNDFGGMTSSSHSDGEELKSRSEPVTYRKETPLSIAWVFLGYPAPQVTDGSRAVASVIQQAMYGWVWREIREKRGWAHLLNVDYDAHRGPSTLTAWAAVPPEHADKTRDIIAAGFENLATKLISEKELKRCVNMAICTMSLSQQSVSDQARALSDLELANLPLDYWDDFPEILKKVKDENVLALAREYFDGNYVGLIYGAKPCP